jgi:hypothetical protein
MLKLAAMVLGLEHPYVEYATILQSRAPCVKNGPHPGVVLVGSIPMTSDVVVVAWAAPAHNAPKRPTSARFRSVRSISYSSFPISSGLIRPPVSFQFGVARVPTSLLVPLIASGIRALDVSRL